MYTRRLVIFLLHKNNSIYSCNPKTPVLRQDPLFRQAKQSTLEQLFNLKTSDLFTGALFIYFVHVTVQRPSCFPLNVSHEPLFLCWDHGVAGMKTVELPPLPPFPVPIITPSPPPSYPFSYHFDDRYGTVFSPLSSTVDSRQLKPSVAIEIKSEWNYVRISKTKPPPPPNSPTSPPTLCKSSNQISESTVDGKMELHILKYGQK